MIVLYPLKQLIDASAVPLIQIVEAWKWWNPERKLYVRDVIVSESMDVTLVCSVEYFDSSREDTEFLEKAYRQIEGFIQKFHVDMDVQYEYGTLFLTVHERCISEVVDTFRYF